MTPRDLRMCLSEIALMSIPVIASQASYCLLCSPLGFPFGEPGDLCSCGAPIEPSIEQVAMTRVLRNRAALAKRRGSAEPGSVPVASHAVFASEADLLARDRAAGYYE
jgi:hypothetical protein